MSRMPKFWTGTIVPAAEDATRRSKCLSLLAALTVLLYACHPFISGSAEPPQRPASPGQSAEATELQHLLDEHRYIEYDDTLLATDPTRLSNAQNLYFSGMLAYHLGLLHNAGPRLEQAVNKDAEHSLTPTQDREALATLGEINFKLSFYSAAAKMYDMLSRSLGPQSGLSGQAVRDNSHLADLLAKAPPQTVELTEDFTLLPADTSPVIGAEYPVEVPGRPVPAKPFLMRFDCGAEISLLSATTARAWGVTMLGGTATLLGAGGALFQAQPGFLPALTIGKAQFHNVAVLVTADQNLYLAPLHLQLNATLGYPVLRALGRLTFLQNGSLQVAAQSPKRDPRSTSLWLADHFLLIELATRPVFAGGKLVDAADDRLFILDTGSGSTVLTDHFLAEHENHFTGQKPEIGKLNGAGGTRDLLAYSVRNLPLFANSSGVLLLNDEHVLAQPMLGPGEDYFGIIGQNVLNRLPGYTIDFRTMTFAVVRNTTP